MVFVACPASCVIGVNSKLVFSVDVAMLVNDVIAATKIRRFVEWIYTEAPNYFRWISKSSRHVS